MFQLNLQRAGLNFQYVNLIKYLSLTRCFFETHDLVIELTEFHVGNFNDIAVVLKVGNGYLLNLDVECFVFCVGRL